MIDVIRKNILLLMIALSLTSVQYHRIRGAVLTGPHPEYKIHDFLSLTKGLKCFKENVPYFHRARVVACLHSSIVCRIFGLKHSNKQHIRFANVIAFDQCVWYFLMFAAIISFSRKPLFFLLGAGAALQYAWLPMAEGQVTPWDGPSLFWWTLVLLINETKYRKSIVYLIPIGAMYKEIIAVLAILILFWDDRSVKSRLILFGVVGCCSVFIKMVQGLIGGCNALGNQSFHFDWNEKAGDYVCRTGEKWIWQRNLHSLAWWRNFNPIYFSVAGVWAGLFLLPIPWKYRIIAIVYCGTVFIPGNITEARLWHELIPVFFVGYEYKKKFGLFGMVENKTPEEIHLKERIEL